MVNQSSTLLNYLGKVLPGVMILDIQTEMWYTTSPKNK